MKQKIILILLLLIAFPVRAEVSESLVAQRSREIFENTMSPYCPGLTLSACPSDDARILREQIVKELAAGTEPETVRAQLAGRFGDMVKGNPDTVGFGSLAILVPGIFVILGGVIIFVFVRKQSGDNNGA